MEHKAMKRPALGRGLSALIPGGSPGERKGVIMLGIEQIQPDRGQPRRYFDETHILELSESIRAKGVLQPLLVRRDGEGYAIVAGERRWRAAQRAGLREVPCIVRDVSEPEAFELALIENIQREDLNAIEEAEAYQRLIEYHGLTQEELAQRVGKDRSTISNALRLLRLPEPIKLAMSSGALSMGHARALLALGDEADLRRAAEKVMNEALSVREAANLLDDMAPDERVDLVAELTEETKTEILPFLGKDEAKELQELAAYPETTAGGRPAIVPAIRGSAWITGITQVLIDPSDPFPEGYLLSDTWPGSDSQ